VRWFFSTFGFLLSWWGAFIASALDSSLVFVLPFGIDALIIYLAARDRETYWIYPLVMTAGSVVGAALTFWVGVKIGDKELPKFVSERHLERLRRRVRNAGAGTLAVSALLPPPFPLTPFVLVCGALEVNRALFFSVFATMRLVRFGAEAWLAHWQGVRLLTVLQSDLFKTVVLGLAIVAVVGTIGSVVMLWRRTRGTSPRQRPKTGAKNNGNAHHRHAV
jgi:membrane protein YqaA with SNARE-associated domain